MTVTEETFINCNYLNKRKGQNMQKIFALLTSTVLLTQSEINTTINTIPVTSTPAIEQNIDISYENKNFIQTAEIEAEIIVETPFEEITLEESLMTEINNLRVSKGLHELKCDPVLTEIATIRAQEASIKWSHTRPDGTDGLDLIPMSYEWAGENLSWCRYKSIPEMTKTKINALINSPLHYENLVAPEYNNFGVASYYDIENDRVFVAYCFGS